MSTSATHARQKPDVRSHANGAETRRALIFAAMKVIAENGVAGASLRSINVEAGSRNCSAAHYHFGSKLAVIEAALNLVFAEASSAQEPLLAALEERARQGRPVSVREVLEAGYLPYLALLSRPDYGPAAAKFASRVVVESDAEIQALLNRLVSPLMWRTLPLLRAALPHVPEEVLKLRIFITVTNVVHGAGDMAAVQNSPFGDLSGGNPLSVLHALFDYMSAALAAPATPLTPADEARMLATILPGA